MRSLEVEVAPVFLDPYGGIMHGVKLPQWRFNRQTVGRAPTEFVTSHSGVPTAGFRQCQKDMCAVVKDEFLESLDEVLAQLPGTSGVQKQCRDGPFVCEGHDSGIKLTFAIEVVDVEVLTPHRVPFEQCLHDFSTVPIDGGRIELDRDFGYTFRG